MDMKKIKFDFSWILLVVFIIFFIIWSILVLQGRFISFDYQIFDEIHHYLINPFLISFFKIITQMGSAIVLIGIVLISLLFIKNKYVGISMGINLFLVSLFNLLLKNIFMISRPDTITLIDESGYIFPSGHAMISFAFYGYLIYLIDKNMKPSILKKVIIIFLILLILFIGFSRIYLGVHHFSDIIGGYIISFAYLILYIKLVKRMGMENLYEVQKGN